MRIRHLMGWLGMSLVMLSQGAAQSFTSAHTLQGYAVFGDKLTFIFDESHYGVQPQRVWVTGEFRNWDASTDHPAWMLQKTGTQWLLTLTNTDYAVIRPGTAFKFRTDDGAWMEPPAAAPNIKGGNLICMQEVVLPSLAAELRHERLIWVRVTPERPLSTGAYRLTDARGRVIPIAQVLPHEAATALVVPAEPLDKRRVYFLEIPALNQKTLCAFDGWFRELVSAKELGANVDQGQTTVRLFAPRAERVMIYLYRQRLDAHAYRTEALTCDAQGVWEITFPEDLHGVYYDFTVHGSDDPGNHFFETHPVHINDPYARVSDDTWGRARIWHRTTPAAPLRNGIPRMEDVIAYEVHVQDFTDNLPLPDSLRGTFRGMVTPGLQNARKNRIGFDYLTDLGINTVHLLPVQEFVHYPTDDWKASFANDPYMISQGISEENYQWGYRTTFAMAVESRYRTRGSEPGREREEFRDLVQAFHDKDIAVIIDLVPNHTGENIDGNFWFFNFNAIDKQYYYRTRNLEHIGAYGNEIKTENRPMTQRWLIDQCLYFIREFGIDGFRIDLAGQIDQQTLLALREAIGPDKIVYGEPWIGSNDPAYEANPDWDWYKEDAPITFFQDDARNAFKGPVFELKSPEKDRGWPGGNFAERSRVMHGLANTFPEDKTPLSGINYLDIHDNFALADQFGQQFDGRHHVAQDEFKLAVTLLYTSLGPIVTHGGSEIMRSKAHAPLQEIVKETRAGYKVYLHGYRDTYNLRRANQFRWETVGQKPTRDNTNDYANMYAFWRGLNAFRAGPYGSVFRVGETPPAGYYRWITPADPSLLGYCIDERVMVLLNAGIRENAFTQVSFPAGTWKLIATTREVNPDAGVKDKRYAARIDGGQLLDITLEPTSLLIWVKE
ncbi:MAG: alpha-amylase family glycosyl hydrolase [Bacteroidia bacterium]|nr:alpha-amylase family glycosyl hydrolase [Bacteroidia bacterium]